MKDNVSLVLAKAELRLEKMKPSEATKYIKGLMDEFGIEAVAVLFKYVRDLVVGEESLKSEIKRQMILVEAFERAAKEGDEGAALSCVNLVKRAGKFWVQAGERSIVGLGMVLNFFNEKWAEIPESARENCQTFPVFVEQFTGKGYSTCMGYINVFKTWFSGTHELPADFDPWQVNPSKLLVATAKFRRGEMGEEDWEVLSDGQSTWADVREVSYEEGRAISSAGRLNLRVDMVEGKVTAFKGDKAVTIGRFYPKTYERNELAREAVDHIVSAANIGRVEE